MFVNHLSASPRHRLNQILHTLKHVHEFHMPVHDPHLWASCAQQAHTQKIQIQEQTKFNSYMQDPAYVQATLVLEAVQILKEIVSKRRRKPVQEHKDHKIMTESRKAKPDFLDLDSDGDTQEPMKQAAGQAKKKKITKEHTIMEDANLDKAQTLLAAKDLTDRLQDMAEDAAKMAVDDLMPLVDTMKDQFGLDAANAFNNVVKQQLQTVLDSIITAKDQTDNAINTMETGGTPQAPSDIGQPLPPLGGAPDMAASVPDMSASDTDAGMADIDFEKEFAAMPATSGPEQEPVGRAKKEPMAETMLTPAQKAQQEELGRQAAEQIKKTRKKPDGSPATPLEIQQAQQLVKEAKNPYAVGMAQAKQMTGDEPPLKKSTIKLAHKIAKKVDTDLKEQQLRDVVKQIKHAQAQLQELHVAHDTHVQTLNENWITQQGDLKSAVIQEQIRTCVQNIRTLKHTYQDLKQQIAEHTEFTSLMHKKVSQLHEQLSRTPFGVTGTWQSGEKFKKFFESVDHRSHWINYNHPRMNSHDLIEPDHVKQVQRKLKNLI
jgi:hypothetical protein